MITYKKSFIIIFEDWIICFATFLWFSLSYFGSLRKNVKIRTMKIGNIERSTGNDKDIVAKYPPINEPTIAPKGHNAS